MHEVEEYTSVQASFNRTFMELKYNSVSVFTSFSFGFNRTFMELKLENSVERYKEATF